MTPEQTYVTLESLLTIVTNPELVSKNIEKLLGSLSAASEGMKLVEQAKAAAEDRNAVAKSIEENNALRKSLLDEREEALAAVEQSWKDKNESLQSEMNKLSHERAINEDNVKAWTESVEQTKASHEARENEIAEKHNQAVAHEFESAQKLAEAQKQADEADKMRAVLEELTRTNQETKTALDARQAELEQREQHWQQKHDEHSEALRKLNEDQLAHTANVRALELKAVQVKEAEDALIEREKGIADKEAEADEHQRVAKELRQTYEDKVASIQNFAKQVG